MKYLLTVAYRGDGFCGFQFQPDRRTVQGTLTQAFSSLFEGPVAVTGCSRTDSGVHATGARVTVLPAPGAPAIAPAVLPLAVARFLPEDISVLEARQVPDDFHPRYDATGKEYLYRVLNTPVHSPFLRGLVWHVPKRITDDMVTRMQSQACQFIGTHDFTSFMAKGAQTRRYVRTVRAFTVQRVGDEIHFTVSADGFLYNMVRIMTGTLLDLAYGRLDRPVGEILQLRDRTAAGCTAPPDGLYLARVFYSNV